MTLSPIWCRVVGCVSVFAVAIAMFAASALFFDCPPTGVVPPPPPPRPQLAASPVAAPTPFVTGMHPQCKQSFVMIGLASLNVLLLTLLMLGLFIPAATAKK